MKQNKIKHGLLVRQRFIKDFSFSYKYEFSICSSSVWLLLIVVQVLLEMNSFNFPLLILRVPAAGDMCEILDFAENLKLFDINCCCQLFGIGMPCQANIFLDSQ